MSAPIPFVTLDEPSYGEEVALAPLVSRVIAENPSRFTYFGTGTYLVGERDVAVIDPGPLLDGHRDALRRALSGRRVTAVLVTHCHSDHSPLANWMSAEFDAPTVASGPHGPLLLWDPDDDDGIELPPPAEQASTGGAEPPVRPNPSEPKMEESVDVAFAPDVVVVDDDLAASGDGWSLTAVRTPGHASNHTCYALRVDGRPAGLFTGDHVMGWSTSVIAPPDGSMSAYMDSLAKVIGRADPRLYPTHGAPVDDPGPFLEAFVAHRLEREAGVLGVLADGPARIREIVAALYADVAVELHKPAARSVLAHLIKLVGEGRARVVDGDRPTLAGTYAVAGWG